MKDRENRTIDAILIVNRCYRFIYKAFIVFGCKVSKKKRYTQCVELIYTAREHNFSSSTFFMGIKV